MVSYSFNLRRDRLMQFDMTREATMGRKERGPRPSKKASPSFCCIFLGMLDFYIRSNDTKATNVAATAADNAQGNSPPPPNFGAISKTTNSLLVSWHEEELIFCALPHYSSHGLFPSSSLPLPLMQIHAKWRRRRGRRKEGRGAVA